VIEWRRSDEASWKKGRLVEPFHKFLRILGREQHIE
jgi:hypothetical protein